MSFYLLLQTGNASLNTPVAGLRREQAASDAASSHTCSLLTVPVGIVTHIERERDYNALASQQV